MQQIEMKKSDGVLRIDGTDLEIQARVCDNTMVIQVLKSGTCVHSLTIDDAVGRLEHDWIADMFAREDRVALSDIAYQAADYVGGLNINQG